MSIEPEYIVGIDEVGRGPLAGPVTVCACKVAADFDFSRFDGIKDSKKLSAKKREEWFRKISDMSSEGMLGFSHFSVPAREIDSLGIAPAIERALSESIDALGLDPYGTRIYLDGALKAPKRYTMQETIIKGDEKIPIISAASIVAKVIRDRYMSEQALVYPGYGFEKNKGYGTEEHCKTLRELGASPIHRKTFLGKILNFDKIDKL